MLPDSSADQYAVSYEIGTTWSTPEIAQPLQTLTLPTGVVGLEVDLEDSKGNPIPDPGSFTFYVTFASSGTFAGNVLDMSVANGTIVSSGATDTVFTSASNVTVLSGGTLDVASGGTASGTRVISRGTDSIMPGGVNNGANLIGGIQLVYGTASNTTISAGGTEIVKSGGAHHKDATIGSQGYACRSCRQTAVADDWSWGCGWRPFFWRLNQTKFQRVVNVVGNTAIGSNLWRSSCQ